MRSFIMTAVEKHYSVDKNFPMKIRNNILGLKELGYEIAETDKGYYVAEREFDDAKLVMLIDTIIFSKNLSYSQKKRLTEKLEKLGNKFFHSKVTYVANLPELFNSENKQALIALESISEAISKRRKIKFVYNKYGIDFKLHPRRDEEYIVNICLILPMERLKHISITKIQI